jgi:hypothetical protein
MDAKEFSRCRKILNKTQKQIAHLLGTSIKAIHSYEQGWRTVPNHAERQILYLLAKKIGLHQKCWQIKKCPPDRRRQCPAFEFHAGEVCWFINGTICDCREQGTWGKKIAICRQCEAFEQLLNKIGEGHSL